MTTDKPSAGDVEQWIDREFTGHGLAVRTKSEPPIPGEPLMSMVVAKDLTRRALRELTAPPVAGAEVGVMRQACDWPAGLFSFFDEPGEHDPCYVVMPGGASLELNHHAGEGVDIARAKFIVDACNSALTGEADRWGGSVDDIAKWLHDETNHPDSYPSHTWPETERDDGQREGGFVKIVPLHGQAYFRDIARRLVARFGHALSASTPVAERGGGGGRTVPSLENLADRLVSIIQDGMAQEAGSKSIASIIINELLMLRIISPTPETGDGSETIGGGE